MSEGVVNYGTGKCIDSKYRVHRSWNWISHPSGNQYNMLSDCDPNQTDHKFTIQPTGNSNEMLLRVSNGKKDQCITTKNLTEGVLESDCNAGDSRYIYTYDLNNKTLKNKADNSCLTVVNDSSGPRLSHQACSSTNELQAFIGGFDTVKRCKELGVGIAKCSREIVDVLPKVCSALGVSPCNIDTIRSKDVTVAQSCLDKNADNCLEETCQRPSVNSSQICRTFCQDNRPSCVRAKECVDLGIKDENCNQVFINTRRQCRDLSISDDKCSIEEVNSIVADCVRLGIRNVLGNNDRQCNAASINETKQECAAYKLGDNICSLNEIREAKTVQLQQQAILSAVSKSILVEPENEHSQDTSPNFILIALVIFVLLCSFSVSSLGLLFSNVKV